MQTGDPVYQSVSRIPQDHLALYAQERGCLLALSLLDRWQSARSVRQVPGEQRPGDGRLLSGRLAEHRTPQDLREARAHAAPLRSQELRMGPGARDCALLVRHRSARSRERRLRLCARQRCQGLVHQYQQQQQQQCSLLVAQRIRSEWQHQHKKQ